MAAMTSAHRTSGIAPLAVFFDAVDTTNTGSAQPFVWTSGVVQPADLEATHYSWDFGDGSSGTWTQTGLSRNTATGYTAAHVYETPGTYTATLTVTETDGTVTTYTQDITVSAFAGTTHYASASGTGDGTSTGTPSSLSAGLTWVNGGAGRRLLLNRGDTFTLSSASLTAAGPSILGAYGTGANPVINTSGGISVSGSDWRVMDLDLVDTGSAAAWGLILSTTTTTANVTFARVKTTGFYVGIGWTDYGSVLANPHNGSTLYECEVDAPSTNGLYLGGYHLALLGNYIHDISTSHVCRVWVAHKGVIAHNKLWNPGATRHALKLHGGTYGGSRPESRFVTVSDNLMRGKTWAVTIGPQDSVNDERVTHVVYERNRHYPEASVQIDVLVEARDILLRNNVFDGTGAANDYIGIRVDQRGIEPAPASIRIYNNTASVTDSASSFACVSVASVASNVTVQNNLGYAPSVSSKAVVSGSAGSGWTSDHNVLASSSPFVDVSGGDYNVVVGSAAVDVGATIAAVREDFRRKARSGTYEVGAYDLGYVVTYPDETTWECVVDVVPGANQFDVTDGTDTITVDLATLEGAAAGQANASGQLRVTVPLTGRADGAGTASAQAPNIPAAFQGSADGQATAEGALSQSQPLAGTASGAAGAGLFYTGTAAPVRISSGSHLVLEAADASTVEIIIPILRAASADESSVTVYVFPSDYYGPTSDDRALYGRADGRAGASGELSQAQAVAARADGRAGASGALTQALPVASRADGQAGATARLTVSGNYTPRPPYWVLVTVRPVVATSRGKGFAYAFPVILGGTEALRRVQTTRSASTSRQRVAKLAHPHPPSLQ